MSSAEKVATNLFSAIGPNVLYIYTKCRLLAQFANHQFDQGLLVLHVDFTIINGSVGECINICINPLKPITTAAENNFTFIFSVDDSHKMSRLNFL